MGLNSESRNISKHIWSTDSHKRYPGKQRKLWFYCGCFKANDAGTIGVSVCSVMSNSLRPYEPQVTRLLCPWGFPSKNHCNGLPFPPPGDLPDPGAESRSPVASALVSGFFFFFFTSEPPGNHWYPHGKIWISAYNFHTVMNSKWNTGLKVKTKIIKLLDANRGGNF